MSFLSLFIGLACILDVSLSYSIAGNTYTEGDSIPVLVSNVAPFHNPSEKYPYSKLPWPCKYLDKRVKSSFGNKILGEKNEESPIKVYYLKSIKSKESVCGIKSLNGKDVNKFINAIKDQYQYEMWIDNLPLYGRIGFASLNEDNVLKYYLITNRHFNFRYNIDQIITVNISHTINTNDYIELKYNENIENIDFTFSVSWESTDIPYYKRFSIQTNSFITKPQKEAHWLWILNSILLVILLTCLLSIILLRTLKNDVARYLKLDKMDQMEMAEERLLSRDNIDIKTNANNIIDDDIDDSGWKRIKGDVFRPPKYIYLYSAIIGNGSQILLSMIFLLILAIIGFFYPGNHGRIVIVSIFLYSFTAYIGGYISSTKLREFVNNDKSLHNWVTISIYTIFLFFGPFLIIFSIINTIAIIYGSSLAMPFEIILSVILLWSVVTIPLTAFGCYKGKDIKITNYPSNINKNIKIINNDTLPWYYNKYFLIIISGFLPFLSIYIELHTIYMSLWSHQTYTLFGILFITFIILLFVNSFIVVLITYLQLTSENHQWWWSSLIHGMSCGIFIYIYAIYYYHYYANMSGTLQFITYFGYSLVFSYAISLMLATTSHWVTRTFVIKIYAAIKSD